MPVQRAGEGYAEYEAQDALDKHYKRVQLQHLCGVFAHLNAEYLCDRHGDFLAAVLAEPFLAQQYGGFLGSRISSLGEIVHSISHGDDAVGVFFTVVVKAAVKFKELCAEHDQQDRYNEHYRFKES